MLKVLLVGNVEKMFHNAIGRGPISGIVSGLIITVMVQSSSTTTSLAVPLAASGKFSIWQIIPTVGANVGTTMTAMIAAFILRFGSNSRNDRCCRPLVLQHFLSDCDLFPAIPASDPSHWSDMVGQSRCKEQAIRRCLACRAVHCSTGHYHRSERPDLTAR